MRKVISLLLVVVLLISSIIFVSCNKPSAGEHVHMPGAWVTVKEPSCKEGEQVQFCASCGIIIETLPIAATISHVYDDDSDATCNSCDFIRDVNSNYTGETVICDITAMHTGNLLLINDSFKYEFPSDLSDMINVYQYQKNTANNEYTKIDGTPTYTLTYDSICLNKTTLDAFNKMILDYCNSSDFTSSNEDFVSNLEIAWGGYSATTRHEYQQDVDNIGKDFYDHALGTTLTLKINDPATVIRESILKNQFAWIYQNAHKYGFIIRYPDACASHTQVNKNVRVHLRYVGVEHATYIFNNQICLEEYLELLRTQHSYSNPLVVNGADGKTYNVYYVEHSGNPTSVPVPKNSVYTISGDNMNGFIVTVEK